MPELQLLSVEAQIAVAPGQRRACFERDSKRTAASGETAALTFPVNFPVAGSDIACERPAAGQHGGLFRLVGVKTQITYAGQAVCAHVAQVEGAAVDPRSAGVRVYAVDRGRASPIVVGD